MVDLVESSDNIAKNVTVLCSLIILYNLIRKKGGVIMLNCDEVSTHPVTCPECGGSGYDPCDGGQCPICGGLGEIEVSDN